MSDIVLEIRNATKTFGPVTAVDAVSLAIDQREFLALLGPSGSGKTTLLRIIAGLEVPDHGSVIINEKDVTSLPPYERQFGIVFQDFLLFPHKTVKENICFPLRMKSLPITEQQKEFSWIVDLMHLEGLEQRYPHQLSGVHQQNLRFLVQLNNTSNGLRVIVKGTNI